MLLLTLSGAVIHRLTIDNNISNVQPADVLMLGPLSASSPGFVIAAELTGLKR